MNADPFVSHSRSELADTVHRNAAQQVEGFAEAPEQRAERLLHVARCAFELIGVTVRSNTSSNTPELLASEVSEQERMTAALASLLGSGQSITFAYEGGGGRPLRWQIVGEAISYDSIKKAGEGLRNIQHALMTALESRRTSYRFKALSENETSRIAAVRHKWIGLIQPQGTQVRNIKGSVGFNPTTGGSIEEKDATVYLPHYTRDRVRAFSSIVNLLVSSPLALRISITMESCHLSQGEEDGLRAARDVILDRSPDSNLPAHLENAANLWLKTLAGCRITCAVGSSRPVSPSFLSMLGGEIYQGDVDVGSRRATDVQTGGFGLATTRPAGILDLRNCFPSMVPLPPLFQQPEALARHGTRRFYNRERVVLPKVGLIMGCVKDGQAEQMVRLCKEERSRHLYILGATGTGKSTLLHNLIMQDIEGGEGACLIDPHGDEYQQVLQSIPAHRVKDVILIDPSDREYAVGLNLLDCAGPHREMQVNFVINEVLAILDKLYDMKTCGGPMFEQYFRGALQLVMADPANEGTLVDMSAVFEHKAFRSSMVKKCEPSLLADFWKMAENASNDSRIANIAPYIVCKLNMLVHNAMLRPIIGQAKSTVNFRQIMDRRGILLVNLSRGALGELDMRLLGMIVLTKLICAAMSRLDVVSSRRTPFHVYVDEFQNFTTDATASLLSESRKFGLCLTLANQNLSQLSAGKGQENLVHSVLGNVGSMVLFRLGAPDAEKLGIYTRPNFGPEDLQTLPNFHAASRLLTPTGPTVPFVFETYPACRKRANPAVLRRIVKNSRRYSTSIAAVELEIQRRRGAIRAMGESSVDKKPAIGATGKA